MKITRRQFACSGVLTGTASFLGGSLPQVFAQVPPSAQELVNRISVAMGGAWNPSSYRDTFKMGDPNTLVMGVASCFMSTFDVIKRANAKGLNFVISHEPTMWTDGDVLSPVEDDPLFKLKLEYVNDNKMIVWRTHDSLHSLKPEPMSTAENAKLGWDKFVQPGGGFFSSYKFSPPVTLKEIVLHYADTVPTSSLRVIGDPSLVVNSASQAGHSCAANFEGLAKNDCTISIEIREWETAEYGRDLVASGARKAMIICSHESGEELGMQWFTNWLEQRFPGLRIEFVPTGDRMWTI